MTAALRQEWQQAGADAASRQREICDALALAAQHIRTDAGPGQRHAGGNQPTGRRRRRRAQAALALQASWPRATASAWTPGAARWPRWPPRCARNGRPAPTPPAASAKSAMPCCWPQDISEQGRAQASGTLAEINRLVDAAAEAPGRRRPAGRAGGRDQARLDAWTGTLAEMAATLRQEWQQAGADAASRQQQICEALADTARQISDQSRAHASDTLAEINRLVDAAAEAPAVALQSDLVARRGPPGCLDRIAGRHGRRAARGMAADRRRHRQPPAGNLRRAGPGRARHLRAHPHPRQRHHRRDRAPGAGRVRAPRAAAEVIGELRRSCPTAWPTTTPCWKSAAACSTRSRPCWTPSTSHPPSNAPPWTRWSAPPRN